MHDCFAKPSVIVTSSIMCKWSSMFYALLCKQLHQLLIIIFNPCGHIHHHPARTALLACQIISKKKVDGVCKFITPSDVNAMKRVKNLIEIEDALKDCYTSVEAAVDEDRLTQAQACGVFGRFCTRVVTMALKKRATSRQKNIQQFRRFRIR